MFKIESLKLSETTEMLLKHPVSGEALEDDDGKPVTFTLFGTSSREYRKAVDVLVRNKKKRGDRAPTMEESRAESLEFITSLTEKIDNMDYEGQALDNKETIKALYSDESLSWIRDQVNAELNSVEAFLKQ